MEAYGAPLDEVGSEPQKRALVGSLTALAENVSGFAFVAMWSVVFFGCRAAPPAAPKSFLDSQARVHVECDLDEEILRIEFEPTRVDRRGIWLEDRSGKRVEPMRTELDGVPVVWRAAQGTEVSAVEFSRADLGEAPWRLAVLARGSRAWNVLLARVEDEWLGGCVDLFGYRRERWTFPSGEERVWVARERAGGERVEFAESFFETELRPSLERTCQAMPQTTSEVLATCAGMADEIASALEDGARYAGPAEGDNRHPHARGERFWSRPRLEPGTRAEDPVDTLVWYLVEAFNARAAEAYGVIWDGVLAGRLAEDEYVQLETLQKAVQLRAAVEAVTRHARCLGLGEHGAARGQVYREYRRWVDQARGDPRALRRTILGNPVTYTDNPDERGLTYEARLRSLYRKHAPR